MLEAQTSCSEVRYALEVREQSEEGRKRLEGEAKSKQSMFFKLEDLIRKREVKETQRVN